MSRLTDYLNESRISFNRLGEVNEIPKKPGWYWIKNVDKGTLFIRYFDGKNIYAGARPMPIEDFIGERGPEGGPRRFAGPIPEPKE